MGTVSYQSDSGLERARSRRVDLRGTMQHLEDVVARPSSGPEEWRVDVRSALNDVKSALQGHIDEVESPDGLLTDVLEDAPRLGGLVAALIKDHGDLITAWERASEAVDTEPLDKTRIRRRVVSLLGRLTLHRQAGSDLVYEAYTVDIGGTG